MNMVIWLAVGGVSGWLASLLMGTNDRQGIALYVLVGIVGAVATGWLLSGMFETSPINHGAFALPGLI